MTDVDFGRRSDDYARHRPGFPPELYDRLETFVPLAGVDAVDLGTGPGTVALELAARGARVTGVDVAPNQVAAAEHRAAARGLATHAAFRVAPAEATGLPDACCDLVTAGQCWTWLDTDRAVAEIARLLRPGGWLCVAHFDYLPGRSAVASATEALILEHNPAWTLAGGRGTYAHHIDDLARGPLAFVEQICWDHAQPFSHADWRGRIRTCNGVGSGLLSDEAVEAFDRALAALLAERSPAEPMHIAHRVWMTVLRRAGA